MKMFDSTRSPRRTTWTTETIERVAPQGTVPLPERVYLASKPSGDDCEVVLAFLPHNSVTPFVTWVKRLDDAATFWGHYYQNLAAAVEGFNER